MSKGAGSNEKIAPSITASEKQVENALAIIPPITSALAV